MGGCWRLESGGKAGLFLNRKERCHMVVLISSEGGLGWILGRNYSLKELLSVGTGCPGQW